MDGRTDERTDRASQSLIKVLLLTQNNVPHEMHDGTWNSIVAHNLIISLSFYLWQGGKEFDDPVDSFWIIGKGFWHVSEVDPESDFGLHSFIELPQESALLSCVICRFALIPWTILQAPIKSRLMSKPY